jgi:dihydrolipoamide dehydrogenase
MSHDWCWVTDMIAEAIVARKLETTGHEILKSIPYHE